MPALCFMIREWKKEVRKVKSLQEIGWVLRKLRACDDVVVKKIMSHGFDPFDESRSLGMEIDELIEFINCGVSRFVWSFRCRYLIAVARVMFAVSTVHKKELKGVKNLLETAWECGAAFNF